MQKDLSNYRRSYEKGELLEGNVPENPLELFQKWFYEIEHFGGVDEPNAMTVSTIGLDGFPKNRVVLLKNSPMKAFTFIRIMRVKKEKPLLKILMFVFLFLAWYGASDYN